MKIFFPREQNNEMRIAIVPSVVKKYVALGAEVLIESGAGKSLDIDDKEYADAGGVITKNRLHALSECLLYPSDAPDEGLGLTPEGRSAPK